MYQNINKIYHAAIYVRLSKEDGDISSSAKLESNSISNQKALILDFLKDKKDIEVVSVRVDDGYSGSNFDRPAFQAMLEDIRRGIVDCVVVKDLSRFGREYIDSGKYIERLFPALGVRFIAINDNYDSLKGKNQADEIIIPFKNLINDAYCRDISKLATTSSTGGLSLALQRAIVTARPKGRYRKHFYWPAIKRYYWNLLFSIPLLAHLYISELLHLLYCRLFQHNIL